MVKSKKGTVELRHYMAVKPPEKDDGMRQWPAAKDLMDVLAKEGVPLQSCETEAFWQAAVRWSLLKKYGHCPKDLESPYDTKSSVTKLHFSEQDIQTINSIWEQQCALAKSSPYVSSEGGVKDADLRQFLSTGLSNGRQLQWSIMDCEPACQFNLHAHPNLEVIYCIKGELHEIRMEGAPLTKTFEKVQEASPRNSDNDENQQGNHLKGPDLSLLGRPWKFDTLPQHSFLVNEVGSIHKSFTATNGDGCKLLVLWGGSHADIPPEKEPNTLNVQGALETMDQRLCDCGNNKSTTVSETFLPKSERSQ